MSGVRKTSDGQIIWPTVSDELVSVLEAEYPPRCVGRNESAEDHIRYAGKVELIADLRSRVSGPIDLSDEEEDAIDEAVIAEAEAKMTGRLNNEQE